MLPARLFRVPACFSKTRKRMKIKPLQILLADDDQDDCEFFQVALEKTSIATQLTKIDDGVNLMSLLNRPEVSPPDFLFLDLNMPRKNGYECLLEIKSIPYLIAVPVIILSLTILPEFVDELYKKGVMHCIKKPNSTTQLTQILEQVLNKLDGMTWVRPSRYDFVWHLVN